MTERQQEIAAYYDVVYNGHTGFSHGNVVLKNKMDRLSEKDCQEMSTDELFVFAAYIGDSIDSLYYGDIIGFFETDGDIYRFTYRIHKPKKQRAILSNRMLKLDKIIKSDLLEIGYQSIATPYGYKAFWSDYSLKDAEQSGENDVINLKNLMSTITAYSRRKDYIRHFRNFERRKSNQDFVEAQSAMP